MDIAKKFVSPAVWIITIYLQVVIGQIAGHIAFQYGEGKIPASTICMWLGITLGVFSIGALAISLRQSISPKYLARFGFTAIGVIIPIAIIATFGYSGNGDHEPLYSGLEFLNSTRLGSFIFFFAAPIMGSVGFYLAYWFRAEKVSPWAVGIIALIPLSYLFFLGYVQGDYLPDYYSLLYGVDDTKIYTINSETILTSLDQGKTNVFTSVPLDYDETASRIRAPGSLAWQQKDYMRIANALHQFVWGESLEGWQLIEARFEMDQCQDMTGGLDKGEFYFYRKQADSYAIHNLLISPLYDEIVTAEMTYYPKTWKSIDLDQVSVHSTDDALLLAEENGGRDARTPAKGMCNINIDLVQYTKYDLHSHPFNLYDWGWEIRYGLEGSSGFGVIIDPYTDKIYRP